MRVGLYLAYSPPNKKMSLKQEGLGRYIAELMKAFVNNGDEITIACPNWVIDSVEELLEEFGINKSKIKYLVPKSEPVLYKLYLRKVLKQKKSKKKKTIEKLAVSLFDKVVTFVLSVENVLVFFALMVLLLIGMVIFSPVIICAVVGGVIFMVARKLNRKIFHLNLEGLKKPHRYVYRHLRNFKPLKSFLEYLKSNYNPLAIQEKIRLGSATEVIRHVNHATVTTDIWYCPMAFWPEFNQIKGTRVICVPDVVTKEFPENFSKYDTGKASERVRKTISEGEYFITYCNYVKESLVEQYFGKSESNIVTIRHAVNETLPYINISGAFVKRMNVDDVVLRFARNILPELIPNNVKMQSYLGGDSFRFDFTSVRYIFYPSQIRGNKNLLTLLKAYEYILREKECPVKLFLTCNYVMDKEFEDYLIEKRLQYDVLSFTKVTNQQLAALYKCADLVVNPTLYEGGFPFTFGEGMSVGTPSVMSRIPQVLDEIAGYELEDMLFDPYDFKDMAERILYGLQHKDELYQKETCLFKEQQKRNWDKVGEEYIAAFSKFERINASKIY